MNERETHMLKLRDEGQTYKEIGEAFDVSYSRARQIVARAERYRRTTKKDGLFEGLDSKLSLALKAAGYKNKEEIHKGMLSDAIAIDANSKKGTIYGVGPKSIIAIREWLSIDKEEPEVKVRPYK